MAINNYPLSQTKLENWVWLSQRTGSYHALPHLKQLYSIVLWQQGFELELIMSCTWDYVPGRPYFSIWQGTKNLEGGGNEANMHTYLQLIHYLWDAHNKFTYAIKESM